MPAKQNKILWYGYLHINGGILVKRYFDQMDIKEASESDFVQWAYGPFEADTRDQALEIMTDKANSK